MSELFTALNISASGMKAQSTRLRIISENVANADTAAATPNEDPYRRQTITFKNRLDRANNAHMVEVKEIGKDEKKPFITKYMPDHPGADEDGYVKMPNVNTMVEMMDMREATRSYEANLGMIEQSRNMYLQTLDILRR